MSQTKNTTTVRKKRVRRNRTTEILKAATTLYGEFGFRGTTLAMVADAVGLTEAGVLHYFPSKVHLLQGVLAYRDQNDFEKYTGINDVEKETVPQLFDLLTSIVAENVKIPGLIRLFTVLVGESIRPDHPSHDFFVDRYRWGREVYVQEFCELEEMVILSADERYELATLIMAVLDGLQIQWLLDPEKVDLTVTFKLFSKIVVGYLTATRAVPVG